jgi:hypothetical protein
MTLQNLGRVLDKYELQFGTQIQELSIFENLPFYDFHNPAYTRTFNHTIGLPKKNGQDIPLFDYEQLLYDTLQTHKYVWIKKATGLGITEFMLRYIAWSCVRDRALQGSQMCIVTGPRIDLAIGLIDRMKSYFVGRLLNMSHTKETVIEINGVNIEAYPSHHLDSMRGLPNVSFIFLDEADFFPPGE